MTISLARAFNFAVTLAIGLILTIPIGVLSVARAVTGTAAIDCTIGVSAGIKALPQTIHQGRPTTLSWSVVGPVGCPYDASLNGAPVLAIGTQTVTPSLTTQYTLTYQVGVILTKRATAVGFSAAPLGSVSTTVNVNTKVVRIKGGSAFWVEKLVNAASEEGVRIIIEPQVNMDLTNHPTIIIREGVILSSDDGVPPRPVRTARALGPKLFTKSRQKPLFKVACSLNGASTGDGVLISGFRLHGPHFKTESGDDKLERGIQITSCLGVEITNMDIAGWSGQAIYVSEDDENPRMFNPDAVYIHDNYIHNNQHKGGNGYGVVTKAGSYARIERNVFDLNRHSITSNGKAGTGYLAAHNLVLKGGGVHGTITNSYTHVLDIHGDANCPSIFHHIWNCGNAGDQFWFIDNAVQFTRDTALKIRGMPRVAAYIDGNVFAHGDLDDAIDLFTSTNVHLGSGATANVSGYDSYGRYGVCDFDGDGRDDFFLPTGRTWWWMSRAKMHWIFLRVANDRLNKVGLGDFNADGKCDVVAMNGTTLYLSSGGTDEWSPLLGGLTFPFEELAFADFNGDKRTDIFRRAPSGQWSVISPGVHGWSLLNSSSFPLSALRFGDFTGDGKADVLSRAGGHWSISSAGLGSWTKLNNLSAGVQGLLIGDINADGRDDIARFKMTGLNTGKWQVSWNGRSDWKNVKSVSFPAPSVAPQVTPRYFIGRFDGQAGSDLLHIDFRRNGRLYSHATKTLKEHNLFPY